MRRTSFLSSHPQSPMNCGTSITRTAQHGHSSRSFVLSEKIGEMQNASLASRPFSNFLRSRQCGCALPALGADIARSNQKARRRLARKLEEMIDVLARLLPQKSPAEARQVATGAIATMMGSIVLARAAGNKMLSDDILHAGRQAVRNQAAVRITK